MNDDRLHAALKYVYLLCQDELLNIMLNMNHSLKSVDILIYISVNNVPLVAFD